MKNRYILSERDLMEYLADTFGKEFVKLIDKPAEYSVGERVLYRMKNGQEPVRKEPTKQDLRELHALAEGLAKKHGGTVINHPYVTSGSSLVRLVDIPGWGSMMSPRDIITYATSDELEIDDLKVDWLLGLAFFRADKMLFNADFTHPQVRAMFIVTYEEEHSFIDTRKIVHWYKKYRWWLQQIKDCLSNNGDEKMECAKVIRNEHSLYVAIRQK